MNKPNRLLGQTSKGWYKIMADEIKGNVQAKDDTGKAKTDKGKGTAKKQEAKGLPKGRTKNQSAFLSVFPELSALCKKYKVLRIELKLEKDNKTFSSVLNTTNNGLSTKFE